MKNRKKCWNKSIDRDYVEGAKSDSSENSNKFAF